jgi:hypothetical protein
MLFFLPILFINIWGLIYTLVRALDFTSNFAYFLSIMTGVAITLSISFLFMFSIDFLIERFQRTVTNQFFYYMGAMTMFGILVINKGF